MKITMRQDRALYQVAQEETVAIELRESETIQLFDALFYLGSTADSSLYRSLAAHILAEMLSCSPALRRARGYLENPDDAGTLERLRRAQSES